MGTSLADVTALRRFLDKRVLVAPGSAPPAIEGQHHEAAVKRAAAHTRNAQHKCIVRRVLALILLLDAAKRSTLLASDPCLFLPSHMLKSSRDMAQEFSKAFLSGGVGDINKHLGLLGVSLVHKQTALHEYDFKLRRGLAGELPEFAFQLPGEARPTTASMERWLARADRAVLGI